VPSAFGLNLAMILVTSRTCSSRWISGSTSISLGLTHSRTTRWSGLLVASATSRATSSAVAALLSWDFMLLTCRVIYFLQDLVSVPASCASIEYAGLHL
jgi:hypothetical protein